MITKNDCLILLADIENKGINTASYTQELIKSQTLPLSVIKFINDNRQLDVAAFYER